MEKNNLKKIIPILIIIVVIMIIIIGAVLISLKKNNAKEFDGDPNGDSIFVVNEANNENTKYIDTDRADLNNSEK